MNGPRVVCAICGQETGIFSPFCTDCSEHMEAVNGICCMDDVCEEDREPPTSVGIFDDIQMPRDPYRQPSSDEE